MVSDRSITIHPSIQQAIRRRVMGRDEEEGRTELRKRVGVIYRRRGSSDRLFDRTRLREIEISSRSKFSSRFPLAPIFI